MKLSRSNAVSPHRKRRIGLALVCAVSLGSIATVGAAVREAARTSGVPTFWAGESGGYRFRWTRHDLTAVRADRKGTIYSARRDILAEYDKIYKEEAAQDPGQKCDASTELRPLSLVGPILSYQREDYVNCVPSAHPSLTTFYVAMDVSHPKRPLSLTDLFPDRDVLNALLADPLIRDALSNLKATTPPKTTGELLQKIGKYGYVSGDGRYYLQNDLLRHFAFHHIEGNKVAVRIGLSHGAEVWRGHLTQMGLLLPIPPRLKRSLGLAAQSRAGFLMNQSDKRYRESKTEIEMRSPARKKS